MPGIECLMGRVAKVWLCMDRCGVNLRDVHGTAVRNRLAVRIAGSHPADRGVIPRYGSNHHGLQPDNGRQEIPVPKIFLSAHGPSISFMLSSKLFLAPASFGSREA